MIEIRGPHINIKGFRNDKGANDGKIVILFVTKSPLNSY